MKELEQVIKREELKKFAQYAKGFWDIEPEYIPRVTPSVAGRAARLKQLGNSVVPQIPEFLGFCILNYENKNRTEQDEDTK